MNDRNSGKIVLVQNSPDYQKNLALVLSKLKSTGAVVDSMETTKPDRYTYKDKNYSNFQDKTIVTSLLLIRYHQESIPKRFLSKYVGVS